MSQAYDALRKGVALQDVMGPKRAAVILPIYYACVQRRLPIYSICAATDVHGTQVDFERLLLPFGTADRVTDVIASLKTISVEGSFEQNVCFAPTRAPVFSLIAVIDTNLAAQRSFPHNRGRYRGRLSHDHTKAFLNAVWTAQSELRRNEFDRDHVLRISP